MQPVAEFIKAIPNEQKHQHSAMLVDAAILLSNCFENPNQYRDLDPNRFQILDVCELGPSLKEFRDLDFEELDAMFGRDLKFLGAEFVTKDDDEYWRIDLNDPYKKFWIDQVLSDLMLQTLYQH